MVVVVLVVVVVVVVVVVIVVVVVVILVVAKTAAEKPALAIDSINEKLSNELTNPTQVLFNELL